MRKMLLALFFICPAATLANVICPDGSYCPDGNTCCAMSANGFGCCPMPSAVCCTGNTCCPEGNICLTIFGICVHVEETQTKFSVSQSLSKTPSIPSEDIPCPGGGSCTDKETCCGSGCCPIPKAACCSDGQHCCPSGYTCDLTRQLCVSGYGNGIPMHTKNKIFRENTLESRKMSVASRVTEKIVYCPGGLYYCPDYNTCCHLPSGQWGCCPFPSATCCSDNLHCCPRGMTCDVSGQRCLNGTLSQPTKGKTIAQPISNLSL